MAHMKSPREYELESEVARLENKLMLIEAQLVGDTSEHNVHHSRLVLLEQVLLKIADIRNLGVESRWNHDQFSIALSRALDDAAIDYWSRSQFKACPTPGCVRGRKPITDEQHESDCFDLFGRRIESKPNIKAAATRAENSRAADAIWRFLISRSNWTPQQVVNLLRVCELKLPNDTAKEIAQKLDKDAAEKEAKAL